MKKLLLVMLAVLFFVSAMPSFAFNGGKLSRAMSTAATVSEWLNMVMHPGMPKPWTNPQLPEKYKQLSEAMNTMKQEIGSIETAEQLKNAKAIAESFKALKGTYRDVGYQAEILIRDRETFLNLHG